MNSRSLKATGLNFKSAQQSSLLPAWYLSVCLILSTQRLHCVEFAVKPNWVGKVFIPSAALTLLLSKQKNREGKPKLLEIYLTKKHCDRLLIFVSIGQCSVLLPHSYYPCNFILCHCFHTITKSSCLLCGVKATVRGSRVYFGSLGTAELIWTLAYWFYRQEYKFSRLRQILNVRI